MTTNYHTAMSTGAAGNSASVNAPLGQLDAALGNMINGILAFNLQKFSAASTLTISSGVITSTGNAHIIAAETSTTDDLDTITAVNNSFLFLKADSGDTITLTSSGNIVNTPVVLSGSMVLLLYCLGSTWSVIGAADAANTGYTPDDNNDYGGSDPGSVGDALDYNAARAMRKGFVNGFECDVTSNAIVTVRAGECLDSTNSKVLYSNQFSINTAGSGIGGIDTGSVASDTFYYVWVLSGSSGTSGVLSTSSTLPTQPAGYDDYRKRVGTVRTDGSSNLHFQKTMYGMGNFRHVYYYEDTTASPFLVLNSGNVSSSPTWDSVDLSAIVPPTAIMAKLLPHSLANGAGDIHIRADSISGEHYFFRASSSSQAAGSLIDYPIVSQAFDITSGGAGDEDLNIYCQGYVEDLSFSSLVYVT